MASRTLINQKGGKFVVLFTSNTELTVASANSGIAGEVVTGLAINQVWFGTDGASGTYWKINRNANTILICEQSQYMDFAGNGAALQIDPAANVVVNCTSSNCTLIIDFQKTSTFTSEY
jgi:hypothetical protein